MHYNLNGVVCGDYPIVYVCTHTHMPTSIIKEYKREKEAARVNRVVSIEGSVDLIHVAANVCTICGSRRIDRDKSAVGRGIVRTFKL